MTAEWYLHIRSEVARSPRPIRLPRGEWISPAQILAALRGLGLDHVLIEGGGITIAQFLEAGLLTRLHVAVAPLLIGAGPTGLKTSPVPCLTEALRPKTEVYGLGSDVLFDCALAPDPPAQMLWPHRVRERPALRH